MIDKDNKKDIIKRLLIINIIFIAIMTTTVYNVQADLAENVLKIDIIKYDPYPVSPDSDFSIWVRTKNVGDTDISDAYIEFVPKYPFTVKSGESYSQYTGIIRKNDESIYKFLVHVDKNAVVGTNTAEIGYRINNVLTKKEFNIETGNDIVDTKGTVKIDKYTINPEVLMPNDIATIVLTIKNSASQYTVKMNDKDYSLNAQVQSAELLGNQFIDVVSEQYYNVGIIGPGDSIDISYTVKVRNNTPDGIYYLDLNLKGGVRLYSLNLKIPIKIDSSSIETTISEISQDNIVLNVANNRPNTLYAVNVLPIGNITLEPSEYFIGTMESDEMFTAKFNIKADIKTIEKQKIKFSLRFKNGNNWHGSDTIAVALNNSNTIQEGYNIPYLPVTILFIIFGILIIRYRKK